MSHARWALFPAASNKEKVSFHLLNGATGHRLKQQYVDSETGAIVDREDRVRGYEVGKGDYVAVTEEELASIEIGSSHMKIEPSRILGVSPCRNTLNGSSSDPWQAIGTIKQ